MDTVRSNLHVVSLHDGQTWTTDDLVEGEFNPRVIELLGGLPDRTKVLIPNVTCAYYRERRSVLVMTFGPEVDLERAQQLVSQMQTNREDVN